MRTIVFKYNPYSNPNDGDLEEIEVDDDTTEKEINEMWNDWIWERVSDHATWYEK